MFTYLKKYSGWIGFAVLSVLLYCLFFSSSRYPIYDDAAYHLRHASLYLSQGLNAAKSFPYLVQSDFVDHPTDPWFGFHLTLAPFSTLGFFGAKIYSFIFVLIFLVVFWDFIKTLRAPNAIFWCAMSVLLTQAFLFRLTVARPVVLSLIFSMLLIKFLLRQNKWGVLVTTTLFALCYEGSMTLTALYLLIYAGCVAFTAEKINYKLLTCAVGGYTLGVILHPNSINYLYFSYLISIKSLLSSFQINTGYGTELLPSNFAILSISLGTALPLWLATLGTMFFQNKKTELPKLLILVLTFIFFALTLVARRFLEYFVPFSLALAAMVIGPYLSNFLNQPWKICRNAGNLYRTYIILIIILLTTYFIFGYRDIYKSMTQTADPNFYAAGATAIMHDEARNRLAMPVVFNIQWDQFPFLFYNNPHAAYITGMDPNLLYLKSQQNFWLVHHMALDQTITCTAKICGPDSTDPVSAIINNFGAKYIFVSKISNPKLNFYFNTDPRLIKIFEDQKTAAYKIL